MKKTKKCTKCKEIKLKEEFYNTHGRCKICDHATDRAIKDLQIQECKKCKEVKTKGEFFRWHNDCKLCESEIKQCNRCLEYFTIDKFQRGHHACRKCVKNRVLTEYQVEDNLLKVDNLRRCRDCHEIKNRIEFLEKNGYSIRRCRKCSSIQKGLSYYLPGGREKRRKYERSKPNEIKLLKSAKKTAKDKKLEFNLELSDIIVPKFCPILGLELKCSETGLHQNYSPSVDRVDNTEGYIKGNIKIISYRANQIKNTGTAEEHIKIAEYIQNHFDNSLLKN